MSTQSLLDLAVLKTRSVQTESDAIVNMADEHSYTTSKLGRMRKKPIVRPPSAAFFNLLQIYLTPLFAADQTTVGITVATCGCYYSRILRVFPAICETSSSANSRIL